jgi:hypothetical protein
MRPSALSDRLDTGLRELAWDEWGQMGVPATPHRRSRWVQDPEALVVFTLEVGRDDPRLFDAVLGWLVVNHALVSVRRLRTMCRDAEDERLLAGALGWLAQRRPRARLSPRGAPYGGEREPLFRGLSAPVRAPDPAFGAVGLLRSAPVPGDATAPDLRAPINLALRLRELLGVGVRAEVVRFLLTVAESTVNAQAVARSAGFAKRNVHEALVSLHAAGVVSQWTVDNEKRYAIDRTVWKQLLEIEGDELPEHRAWPQLLAGLRTIRRWLHRPGLDELSEYMLDSRARELLEDVRPDFAPAGVVVPRRNAAGSWAELEALVERLLLDLSSVRTPA